MDDFEIKKIPLERKRVEKPKAVQDTVLPKSERKEVPMKRSKKKRKVITSAVLALLIVFVVAIIFIVLPLKRTYAIAQEAITLGKEAKTAATNQDLVLTGEKLTALDTKLAELKSSYQTSALLNIIPFVGAYYRDGLHGINASIEFVKAGQIAVAEITPYSDLLGLTKGESSFVNQPADKRIETAVKTFEKVTPKLTDIGTRLEVAKKEIDQINPNRYPAKIKDTVVRARIQEAQTTTSEGITMFISAKPLLEILPSLLGEPTPKRYLILFQNDKELRATGGFITAYAIFKVDKGKFIVETSDDIYKLDERQIKRLPAPPAITKYFKGSLYGYLRDSNLSPDFNVSMKKFEDIYNNNIHGAEKYDGIIALDTNVLVEAIRVLDGEIFIPEYNTKFTIKPDPRCDGCPNVVYELEDYSGSIVGYVRAQRKDIISRLMLALMQKSLGVSPGQYWGPLMQTFFKQIQEKHIVAFMHEEKAQSAMESLNFAGRISDYEGDYLHINDVNFGGAKSNMFVKHAVKQEIEVSGDGTVTKTLTIDYKNPSKASNCNLAVEGGLCLNAPLRNWLRVYVPKGSKLIEFKGAEAEGIKPTTNEDLGKTVFEGFLIVRPEGAARVTLKYELPFKAKGIYNMLIQKQPGTEGHEYTTILKGREADKFNLTTDREFRYKI